MQDNQRSTFTIMKNSAVANRNNLIMHRLQTAGTRRKKFNESVKKDNLTSVSIGHKKSSSVSATANNANKE